jgi:alkylation response protein AidB-like acyl-CoA dehydrogenase
LTAIATQIPEVLVQIGDSIEAFCKVEVIGRHEANHALLNDPRNTYCLDGRYADEVIAHIKEVRMASAKAGFYNVSVPENLGGAGFGMLAYYYLVERIYRICGAHNWLCDFVVSHWAFGPSPVLSHVTERAKSEILSGMLAGETSMCFGMSEPGAGSDAAMLKTRAVKDGDNWKISGRKIWTTHIPIADYCIVFAITDPERASKKAGGISTFLVPTSAPGLNVESVIRMHGHIGGSEGITALEDVEVESWQLVGKLHEGFRIGLFGVSMGRIYNSARAVGLARWALEMAIDYAQQREAFGNPISEYQGVSFPLAEATTEIHAAHLMGLNVAQLLDNGERAVKELSMTKSYSVQAAVRAVDRAIQTHGAMGFTNELGLHEAYARVRQANVADGTNEILSRTIAQRLFKGDVEL